MWHRSVGPFCENWNDADQHSSNSGIWSCKELQTVIQVWNIEGRASVFEILHCSISIHHFIIFAGLSFLVCWKRKVEKSSLSPGERRILWKVTSWSTGPLKIWWKVNPSVQLKPLTARREWVQVLGSQFTLEQSTWWRLLLTQSDKRCHSIKSTKYFNIYK